MDARQLLASITQDQPPADLGPELRALWEDARGDWDAAHELVQSDTSRDAAHVHAYLHRKEGDLPNADYWYRRAGVERPQESLEAEWLALAERLLDERG